MKAATIAVLLIALGLPLCLARADEPVPVKKDTEAQVMAVLDEFMAAFNRVDVAAWEKTFHFPHYRLASGNMTVLETAGQRTDADLRAALESIGWDHSEWDRRNIIHMSDTKAHVDTRFSRYRGDGSLIGSYESLYILTRENGRWGVKLRSSYAQ